MTSNPARGNNPAAISKRLAGDIATSLADRDDLPTAGVVLALQDLHARVGQMLEGVVADWRAEENPSYSVIGEALGITRQSAWERFHRG